MLKYKTNIREPQWILKLEIRVRKRYILKNLWGAVEAESNTFVTSALFKITNKNHLRTSVLSGRHTRDT